MTSIPAFHVSTKSLAKAKAEVFISTRHDSVSSGKFTVSGGVHFDPAADEYPVGPIKIHVDLSDSVIKGTFETTSVELVNSFGKHNPTIFLTGRCKIDNREAHGLRYWLMMVDNKRTEQSTPDIIGFAIHDRNGNRVAYGTGPVITGDVEIGPS